MTKATQIPAKKTMAKWIKIATHTHPTASVRHHVTASALFSVQLLLGDTVESEEHQRARRLAIPKYKHTHSKSNERFEPAVGRVAFKALC